MNQIANYNKSIHLLLISVEALDAYFFLNNNINNFYYKNNKNISENEYSYYLFTIYNLLYTKYLYFITLDILNDYCNNINSNKIFKYINRFEYIYRKRQHNNTKKNYIKKRSIKQIAINNLYIIYEITGRYGFYKFCHYISIIKKC
uniref:Uncharacterized protein n=1 Tax=Betaphycus gelatinus TaxID=1191690 RepID=A0A8E7PG60_9FLOR|nr:hypothetical protein [Betaphycus gelatinus]